VAKLRRECGPDFLLYSGDDLTGRHFCQEGGDGVISVTANVAPLYMRKMICKATVSGDHAGAAKMDICLRALHSDLFCRANPIPVKWAVHRVMSELKPDRWDVPTADNYGVRSPLCTLDEEYFALVEAALVNAGAVADSHGVAHDILEENHIS
jgi:4-hydroxy-tetrahydrodipicolinate synthase